MRKLTKAPITPFDITGRARPPLSTAISKLTLRQKRHGTDIKVGVELYTPIVTLLAETLFTRRQDLVFCAWPILCCPFTFYASTLPPEFSDRADMRFNAKHKPTVLWELLDLFQSVGKWGLPGLVGYTRAVEEEIARHEGLMEQLQAAADTVRERHDREGIMTPEPGMTEGIVIPADGIGRVN